MLNLSKISLCFIALFTIIRTDRNMLLACYSHKHISYRIRTIIRKAINSNVALKVYRFPIQIYSLFPLHY
nr:hypothetical protein [Wolbachia endosymbiont (group A) of Scambus nigricans]